MGSSCPSIYFLNEFEISLSNPGAHTAPDEKLENPSVWGAGWRPFLKEIEISLSNPEPQTAPDGEKQENLRFNYIYILISLNLKLKH